MRRWLTEFDGLDAELYAGPIILADSAEMATAIQTTCVRGPNGQALRLLGELIDQVELVDRAESVSRVLRRRAS